VWRGQCGGLGVRVLGEGFPVADKASNFVDSVDNIFIAEKEA
jgi:hypothetical protein